jgi:hypothetical protein
VPGPVIMPALGATMRHTPGATVTGWPGVREVRGSKSRYLG